MLLNPDFKAVKSPDIRFGVSKIDSFHGSLFTQWHFYLVFYSKNTNNIFVLTAAIDWYEERNIYFWARHAKSSNAKVDYLVTAGMEAVKAVREPWT